MQQYEGDMDWNRIIKLYNAEGKEIKVGRKGSLYAGSGGIGPESDPVFTIELDSYDLIDPAEVSEINIDGQRYQIK